jgi:RNA polymerase sigma-70 factor (ECF subfamily)
MRVSEERLKAATFEELALPLFDQLYNFARWMTQDTAEAEDLVQETYAKALRGFSSFQPGTNFRAWMYRILRNCFLSSRTGLKTMVSLEEDELPPAENLTPEDLLIAEANREMVQGAMEELPARFREILLLCEVEDMSYREISEALGIAEGTVMSRLHRARQALRAALRSRIGGGQREL